MPAFVAARQRIPKDCSRRMGRRSSAANSDNRSLGICFRNFVEHALRCRLCISWLNYPREHDFFRRLSAMAASGGHGVLSSFLLPRCTHCRAGSLWATEHDQRWLLRHSGRTRRRFCDSHHRTLLPGARRWRSASASDRDFRRETWTGGFLWRAYNSSWFSRVIPKRGDEFLRTRSFNCDRDFRRGSVHVLDFVSVCSRTKKTHSPRLAF